MVGAAMAAATVLLWWSDERRLSLFTGLALFLPYVAVIAPFRCGGYTRRGKSCRHVGWGLLVGCSYHRFDRLSRIFGHDRDRRAAKYHQARQGEVLAAASGGIPRPLTAAGQPTRPRVFDLLTFAMTALGTVAGWLALIIDPGKP